MQYLGSLWYWTPGSFYGCYRNSFKRCILSVCSLSCLPELIWVSMSAFWQAGFVMELVLCMGWMSECYLHSSPALSWRQTPCSSVQESFRKCQNYGGGEGRYGTRMWREKLVKQNSRRSSSGNGVAESMWAGAPRVLWMLACILLNEKSQPYSELQGCNSTLRIWWLWKAPELCCPGLTTISFWRQL